VIPAPSLGLAPLDTRTVVVQATTTPRPDAISFRVLVCIALLIGLSGFGSALLELVRRWSTQEEYGHGFLIPLVAVWLLWKRSSNFGLTLGPSAWAGPAIIFLSMIMHIVGELSAIFVFSQLAFIVALIGTALGIGGVELFRVTFVPTILLIFAIPLPYFIDANLSLQLQLISSELGVSFIRMFQIPAYLDGNVIELGNYKLQVVDACSGLRYLFPLLSLGFLAAYLFQAPAWQRALVFLSTVPITIAMNSLRIGIVGVSVDRWGLQTAEGMLHIFEGWIIFVACALLLAGEIYLLARISGRSFFEVFYVPIDTAASLPGSERGSGSRMPLTASLFLVAATGLISFLVSDRSEIIPERHRFAIFPQVIGEWQGHLSLLDPEIEHGLALDDYILSDYTRLDGKAINLYVAYYVSQRKGESPHSPVVCIPGGGWLITDLERTTYRSPEIEQPLNRAVIERDGAKQIVYYWYEERGRKIASEYWSKLYLLVDSITKKRSDGGLVRLITPVFPDELESDADKRLQSFMYALLPSLGAFLPGDALRTTAVQSARKMNPT
jgi:exosortase D (VPLPA-CTERM-specific)